MTADEGSARQTLSVADLEAWVRRSAELIGEHAEELTELDAAIGDADHGTNMKRGLAAAVDAVGAGGFTAADALLKKVGTTLVSTVGGASGPLLAHGSHHRGIRSEKVPRPRPLSRPGRPLAHTESTQN